ncbi:hypothetical protein [uncultured Thiodictyon sp.]|uniref:hypothetical protein n=1 Tax=uncultured Thiodictyon sp. TaxID=1846217 RepID=UPI0025E36EB4|nr:hypothetical protein [uncultured Thiodictyon sp.]
MRYAAKRTWPDRPKAWEHQGEAETIEAFALTFAAEHGLGVGSEFEVLDKDSDDAALVPFRVVCTIPYTLGPVESHADAQAGAQAAPPSAAPPFAGAAMSFGFYMFKVTGLTVAVMVAIIIVLKYFGLTGEPG